MLVWEVISGYKGTDRRAVLEKVDGGGKKHCKGEVKDEPNKKNN